MNFFDKLILNANNCININSEYDQGTKCFTQYSSREINIYGMKGIQLAQNSLDTTEHNTLRTTRDATQNLYTGASFTLTQNIKPIKPLNGNYEIVPDIFQDGVEYLMTKYFDLPIKGKFQEKRDSFDSISKWDDSHAYTTNDTNYTNNKKLPT